MVFENDVFFFFLTCNCPVFSAPFVEKTVFPMLCGLASFVTVSAWIYFWAMYPVHCGANF